MFIGYILALCLLLHPPLYQQTENERPSGDNLFSPLVIVPGDGGSRASASVKLFYFRFNIWVWVNYILMILPEILSRLFRLEYDPKTHTTKDPVYSSVTFPGWGSTEMIECLDTYEHKVTIYFGPLVKELLNLKYYQRNKTLRGAPYDFRKAPNENQIFFDNLKLLIEDTYNIAGNERIVLLGHSLGSMHSLYFLNKMTVSWKKKYIKSFISVSGPLGGAVKAAKSMTSGDSFGSKRKPINFREMERSFPSTAFLLPNPKVFGNKPIISTPTRNYSASNYDSLFKDLNFPFGAMMYNDTRELVDGSKSPQGISQIYCIHGYDRNTAEQLVYSGSFNEEPVIIYGNGDSTVNFESLSVCKKWKNVKYYPIKGADHMKIVEDTRFINIIKNILSNQPTMKFTSEDELIRDFIIL